MWRIKHHEIEGRFYPDTNGKWRFEFFSQPSTWERWEPPIGIKWNDSMIHVLDTGEGMFTGNEEKLKRLYSEISKEERSHAKWIFLTQKAFDQIREIDKDKISPSITFDAKNDILT